MNQKFTILTSPRVILNPKQIKNKITVNCTFCQQEFQVWKSKYEKAQSQFNGHLYCSRECSRKNQPALYDKFNWCGNCKWVPKEKAVLRTKGSIMTYVADYYNDYTDKKKERYYDNILTQKVNSSNIITRSPVYRKYKLKKDRYYCHLCNTPLVTKQPRKNK